VSGEKEEADKPKTNFKKSVVKNVAIILLCLLLALFQAFFPYFYYSSAPRSADPGFQVGIYYVYEQDNMTQIHSEVGRIQNMGFEVIRISLVCDPTNPNAYANDFSESVALVILNHVDVQTVRYYLSRWGSNLTYIQVLNEPELSSSWDFGALYTDYELFTLFDRLMMTIQEANLNVQLYTNFEPGFVLRPGIPIEMSKRLDFVGFDVYLKSLQIMSPNFTHCSRKLPTSRF